MTYVHSESVLSRAAIHVQRQARRLRVYRKLLESAHDRARARHRDSLPSLAPRLESVLRELRERGIAQRPLAELVPDLDDAVRVADRFVQALARREALPARAYLLVPDHELLAFPEPYLCGLAPPLLDLAERYFGLPVNYLGVNVKRELANGQLMGTRQWHCDPEDENVLKIIVYLNDVHAGTGPFECMDLLTSEHVRRETGYLWGGNCDDEAVCKVSTREEWVTCLGPRLTANLCDAARCLHRASPPTHADRYSMTFSYLTREAYFAFADGVALQRQFLDRWSHRLSARQRLSMAAP